MRGSIAINKEDVDNNTIGWSVFDFFRESLKNFTDSPTAGWYAYKLRGDAYYFYWTDNSSYLSERYLKSLKKDGWTLGVNIKNFTNPLNTEYKDI